MELALLIVIAALFALIAWRLWQPAEHKQEEDPQSLILLQNQIAELNRTMEAKLGDSAKAISDSTGKAFVQMSESMRLIQAITKELEGVKAGQQQMAGIADNLKGLQDILKNPKQRGGIGEQFLKNILENVFAPDQYEMQHPFKDGTIVDAVIKTREGLVPVDSKFSLENYQRLIEAKDPIERERYEAAFYNDLKLRIDETSKYIKPAEDTLEFAFMYIPSEAIYYDLLTRKVGVRGDVDLVEYATGKKKVIIVSPTTFFAYLQTVMQGLKALSIEESVKKIGKNVSDLGKHLTAYQEYMQKVGKNLSTTVSAYNAAGGEFRKIDKDVLRITGEQLELEAPTVEKPEDQ